MAPPISIIASARADFHKQLLGTALTRDNNGVVSIADRSSKVSLGIALALLNQLDPSLSHTAKSAGQTAGTEFELAVAAFLNATFKNLNHIRPGQWEIASGRLALADFEQYAHLRVLFDIAKREADFRIALGTDYLIKPDVLVLRRPESDDTLNGARTVIDASVANHAPLRAQNNEKPILHASISCKWTIRSDRAQNSRTEALNLIKHRKGRVPHVIAVTGEPVPSRIASLALGTGELDCVYHFALPELVKAVASTQHEDAAELLNDMVEGRRLRDISDLPLDLAL